MKYRVTHRTTYRYQDKVVLCHNSACLLPRDTPVQYFRGGDLKVSPQPSVLYRYQDFFGNTLHYFSVQSPHEVLTVTADSTVEILHSGLVPLPAHSPPWEQARDAIAADTSNEGLHARAYVLASPYVEPLPQLVDYARESFPPARPVLDAVRELMQRIFTDFTYDPGFTTLVTPLASVFEHRRGVCQDFAHLMLACLRGLGLAARYVSGYLETLPPPGQTKLQGSDASHAWIAVYVPDHGWTDFDPTNYQIPTQQHITTAWGRDYSDVTPLKGVIFGGGGHILEVAVDVERIDGKR